MVKLSPEQIEKRYEALLLLVGKMRVYQKRCEQYKVSQDLMVKKRYEDQVDEIIANKNPTKEEIKQQNLF